MRLLGLAAAVLLTSVIAAPAIAEDLLKPGDTISGRLRFFQHQHPNGTWINVYQLTSDNPRKFAQDDDFCDPKSLPVTFHLLVMNDKAKKARLDRFLDKKIAVVADTFFCSETAWHVGDAVLSEWYFAEPAQR
jgi:hypothetical protein